LTRILFAQAISVARACQRLGTVRQSGRSMMPEVARRTTATMAAYTELRRGAFMATMHDEATRVRLYKSLLLTRLLFIAGTWSELRRAEAARLAKPYVRPFRAIFKVWADRDGDWIADGHVLAIAQVPRLEAAVAIARLRVVRRVLRHAPPYLCRLLEASGRWVEAVKLDATWMQQVLGDHCPCPVPGAGAPEQDWHAVLVCTAAYGGVWAASMRRLTLEAVRPAAPRHPAAAGQSANAPPRPDWAPCYLCGMAFPTQAGLRMHSRMVHGQRSQWLQAVHGTCFLVCLRQFHVRCRFVAHLRGRRCCFEAVRRAVPMADDGLLSELLAMEKAALRRRRGTTGGVGPFDLTAITLQGPRPSRAPPR